MGYRLNRLDEPVFIAVSKPLLTQFGIHHRLESCEEQSIPSLLISPAGPTDGFSNMDGDFDSSNMDGTASLNWSELILIMSDPSREESPPSEADVEAKWFTRPPPLMFAKGLLFRLFRRICRVEIFAHHNYSYQQ